MPLVEAMAEAISEAGIALASAVIIGISGESVLVSQEGSVIGH